MSPLSRLVQSIHLATPSPAGLDRFILSTHSEGSRGKLQIVLYGADEAGEQLCAWKSTYGIRDLAGREAEAAEAIRGGFLHLEFPDSDDETTDTEEIEVQLLPPGKEIMTVRVSRVDPPRFQTLFEAALDLLSQSSAPSQDPEMRALRAELSQKEAEILHLNARLQSLKAAATRTSSQDKRRTPISPQKKPPPNASALQPNQKRRRVVEDEFAGSSEEDEEED